MKFRIFFNVFLIWVLFITVACSTGINKTKNELHIACNNPEIRYCGRIDSTIVNGTQLYWSGTSITLNFEGENISAIFEDNNGDSYYNIIIDGNDPYILRPDTIKQLYQLASNLGAGAHNIEIFKRTEWDRGTTTFYGFKIEGKAKLLPKAEHKKKKIEFYGNSITAGYAVEDFSGKDSPDSIFTNNYLSYSAITARHFDAQYHCICKSGIGITISWFPTIMPEIYDLVNPENPKRKWDFSLYTPDIVVVNLFQNDSWLVNMPERDDFKTNFGDKAPTDEYLVKAYKMFISSLRVAYPNAKIICALGSMDATREGSKWPGIVTQAKNELNDGNIFTHFIAYKKTGGHPSIEEQEAMANSLIQFIDNNVTW